MMRCVGVLKYEREDSARHSRVERENASKHIQNGFQARSPHAAADEFASRGVLSWLPLCSLAAFSNHARIHIL